MQKITVSLEEDHVDHLEARAEEANTSRSEALRVILDEYVELRTEYEELQAEYEETRTRLEQREDRVATLEEQLARRSQVEEKVDVLAQRVEEADEPAPPWPVRWWRWLQGDKE